MALRKRLFFATADSTAETVFTNVTGQTTKIESVTMANPSSGLATVIRLSIGTDAATTRVIEYSIPAGTGTYIIYPGIILTGTETIQLSSTVTDDVVVVTGNGSTDIAS